MVQRVELVPASVRGYGNVVSPKVVGDFEVFNCSLSKSDDVFSMVYGAGEVSVALVVSPATVTYGQSVVLEATVLEDNNPLEGVTVQFFDGNSVLGTGTSDVNGVASLTVSDLSVGSHSINAQYDSESSNSVSVTVNVPYTDITLTSTKDTLSFADGDSATLTVQLVDGQGDAVSYAGESVTFEVHKVSDDSLVETLTPGTTNSSGIATTTMNSRGTGDVYIKSSCGLVSKTYEVEDCVKYNDCSSILSSNWSISSSVSQTVESTGLRLTASAYARCVLDILQNTPFSFSFKIVDKYSNGVIIYCYTNGSTTPNVMLMAIEADGSIKVGGVDIGHNYVQNAKYCIEYTQTEIKLYENDVLLTIQSQNVGLPTKVELHTGTNRWAIYKDLKLKPL